MAQKRLELAIIKKGHSVEYNSLIGDINIYVMLCNQLLEENVRIALDPELVKVIAARETKPGTRKSIERLVIKAENYYEQFIDYLIEKSQDPEYAKKRPNIEYGIFDKKVVMLLQYATSQHNTPEDVELFINLVEDIYTMYHQNFRHFLHLSENKPSGLATSHTIGAKNIDYLSELFKRNAAFYESQFKILYSVYLLNIFHGRDEFKLSCAVSCDETEIEYGDDTDSEIINAETKYINIEIVEKVIREVECALNTGQLFRVKRDK